MFKQICFQKSGFKVLRTLTAINKTSNRVKNGAATHDILPTIIEGSSITKPSDWRDIRTQLLRERNFTEKNIDVMLINYCISNKKYDYAKKYIAFVNEANIKPNLGTIGKYFKLFYMMYYDKLTNDKDEEDILKTYEDLRKEYELLDSITIQQIICALSVTKYWKKCLDLLQESKITGIPTNLAYNTVIAASFRNNENELAWQLFNEMIENNRQPLNVMYETIIDQLKRNKPTEALKQLEQLFEMLDTHDLHLDKEIAYKLINSTKHLNVNAISTKISAQGVCFNCKAQLENTQLTDEEFSILRENFFKEVVIGRNVFCKTTPEELERFKLFVKNMGHFDVVIDGLNTQYSQGVAQSPQAVSTLLANVVNYFERQDKTVLLLGKSHMEQLPVKNWSVIKRNSTTFLTQDISHDDPFILYCALNSGINTSIVTRDLMRNHLYLLKDKQCKKLFRRWLAQNRLHLVTVKDGKVIFKQPLKYTLAPQKTTNGWHIPYIHQIIETPKSVKYYRWMCMSM